MIEQSLSKAVLGQNNNLVLPDDFLRRRQIQPDQEWWVNQRDGSIILLPRVPDLRKLYIEPTTLCNLKCHTCIRNVWEHPGGHMKLETFHALMEQLEAFPQLERVVFVGFGEPFTQPHILEMIQLVRQQDLKVTIVSNGLLLDQATLREIVRLGVDRLVVSLDGVTPETYAGVRGASLAKVLDNIRNLNEVKSEMDSLFPALGIEFVALRSNVAELERMSELASRLNASSVLVSNVLAYTDEMWDEILYGYEPRLPLRSGSWPVRADAWVMWGTLNLPRMQWGAEQRCRFVNDRAAVIGWDGAVTPCMALSQNYSYLTVDGQRKQVTRYELGNITEASLLEIWTSEEYCRFRGEVRDFHFPSCPNCDLRDNCDLRENNEACWGWNPSCSDCLWAQDIVRCP
jgi:tungsten cofactor oxidoreducase radical SAM maturase